MAAPELRAFAPQVVVAGKDVIDPESGAVVAKAKGSNCCCGRPATVA